jgi:hypothetical protein
MEEFVNIIKDSWKPYDENLRDCYTYSISTKSERGKGRYQPNGKRIKKKKMTSFSKKWKKVWRYFITVKDLAI